MAPPDVLLQADDTLDIAAQVTGPGEQLSRQITGPIEQILGQIEAIAQGHGPYAEADTPAIVEAREA